MPRIDDSWSQADTDAFLEKAPPLSSCPPAGLIDNSYRGTSASLGQITRKRATEDSEHRKMVGGSGEQVYLTTNTGCKAGYDPEKFPVPTGSPPSVGNATTGVGIQAAAAKEFQESQNPNAATSGGGRSLRRKKSHRRKKRKTFVRRSRKPNRRKTKHHRRKHTTKHKIRRKKHSRKH